MAQQCLETLLGANSLWPPRGLWAPAWCLHGDRRPWVEQYEAPVTAAGAGGAGAGAAAADGREPGSLLAEAEELPGGPAEASSPCEEAAGQGEAAALSGRGKEEHTS